MATTTVAGTSNYLFLLFRLQWITYIKGITRETTRN